MGGETDQQFRAKKVLAAAVLPDDDMEPETFGFEGGQAGYLEMETF